MHGFDQLWIWDDPDVAAGLGWYRDVASGLKPAKFRIARSIPAETPLESDEQDLWRELDRLTPVFLECQERVREEGNFPLPPVEGPTLLGLARRLTYRMLSHCNFCRWDCGVDRTLGAKRGTCKLDTGTRVSTFFHHFGEEIVYRGRLGSGTIFFTSCNMRCAFCQNGDISTDKDNGLVVDPRTLAAMAWILGREGCHNINWVGGDPTIHLHAIIDAISILGEPDYQPEEQELAAALRVKSDGLFDFSEPAAGYGPFNTPMLWNSNFIMSAEAMKILRLLMDVWLPDFKFGPGRCALDLARTPWYWETVTENLLLLKEWGEDFTIRHLVMPNHVECCTFPVLDWIAENMPHALVNIMDQFHPDTFTNPQSPLYRERFADLSRRPTAEEIRAAFAHGKERGIRFEAITFEKDISILNL